MKNPVKNRQIRQELHDLGSSLPGSSRDAGFGLPQGYFDRLPQAIGERIANKQNEQSHPWLVVVFHSLMQRKIVPALAVGLLLLGIASSLWFYGRTEGEYFADGLDFSTLEEFYSGIDPFFELAFYGDIVMESDLSQDDILEMTLNGSNFGEGYVDAIEMVFEEAVYYGMDSRTLLTSLY